MKQTKHKYYLIAYVLLLALIITLIIITPKIIAIILSILLIFIFILPFKYIFYEQSSRLIKPENIKTGHIVDIKKQKGNVIVTIIVEDKTYKIVRYNYGRNGKLNQLINNKQEQYLKEFFNYIEKIELEKQQDQEKIYIKSIPIKVYVNEELILPFKTEGNENETKI